MAVRIDRDQLVGRQRVGVGEVQDDAVVRPQRVRLDAVLLAQQRAQREAPRARARGHRTARARTAASRRSRRGSARPRSSGRRAARPSRAPARAGSRRASCAARSSQAWSADQPLHRALVVERGELALQATDGASQLERPTRLLAAARTGPARAGRGRGRRSRGRARSARCARPRRPAGRPGPRAPRAPSPRRARRRGFRRRPGRRRRARGRGSSRHSRSRCAGRPRVRAGSRWCAPRRCAAAAPRTRPTGSGPASRSSTFSSCSRVSSRYG